MITLNKTICKKCTNESFNVFNWGIRDEEEWKEGYVGCPQQYADGFKMTVPIGEIPDRCKYKLEQIIMSEQENEYS